MDGERQHMWKSQDFFVFRGESGSLFSLKFYKESLTYDCSWGWKSGHKSFMGVSQGAHNLKCFSDNSKCGGH